ncbi:MAG TPA: glycosyltransferase family 2 protein [Stellaceae bacterium]|nr:glycosyltransferase family 2 protein [Stellaceae bacterium]
MAEIGGDGSTMPAAAPRLSALVVARNEAARIGACLERLRFADEIVVVLDRSTDATAEIARSFGARLVEGGWELEGERRNAGIAACSGDWILEVDADEWVTPELAAEIRARIATAQPGYFLVPMANHIGNRLVRHGWGAYNGVAAKSCLFAKGMKHWGAGRVHPRIDLAGRRQVLQAPLLHFVYRDLADMLQRLNRYTDLAALDAIESGKIPPLRSSLRRIGSRAWKSYVARRGYREGPYGIALALASALYPILTHLKAVTRRDAVASETATNSR